MIIEFDKSFAKSLDQLNNNSLYPKIEKIIETAEAVSSIAELPNVKKLTGFKTYYRFRIGDYRLGFEKINEETLRFIIISHRKDIYKKFP
jgi:mRNA interferase RelE/StbE